MTNFLSNKKLVFVCILAINAMMYYLLSHSSIRTRPFGDDDFHEETKIITQFIWGNEPYANVSVTKAPGPVIYFLIPYIMTGPSPEKETYWIFAIIWNCIGSAAALLLLSRAAEKLSANRLTGIIPVIFAFAIPLHVYYGTSVTGEVPAFIGMAVMVYACSRIFCEKDTSTNKITVCALAIGTALLTLSRPNTSLLFVFMTPLLFILWKNKSTLFRPLAYGMTFALLTVILVSTLIKQLPNTRKSYKQLDYLAYVILQGCFQFRDEPNDWRFFDPSVRPDSKDMVNYRNTQKMLYQKMADENKSLSEVNLSYIINDVIHHPFTFLRQCVTKTMYGHSLNVSSVKPENFSLGPLKGKTGYHLFYYGINLFNCLLVSLCLFTLFSYYKWHKLVVILIPWLALLAFHAATYMEYRYMFPVRTIILCFSAIGIIKLMRQYCPSLISSFELNTSHHAE